MFQYSCASSKMNTGKQTRNITDVEKFLFSKWETGLESRSKTWRSVRDTNSNTPQKFFESVKSAIHRTNQLPTNYEIRKASQFWVDFILKNLLITITCLIGVGRVISEFYSRRSRYFKTFYHILITHYRVSCLIVFTTEPEICRTNDCLLASKLMTEHFTITLSSNASSDVYPSNTLASFRTCLPTTIELERRWQVGLTEITYPRKIYNIRESTFDFYYHVGGKKWIKNCKFGKGVYTDLEQVVEEIHRSIHRARGVWNKEALKKYFSWLIDLEGKFVLNYPETVRFADMSPDLFHILGC